MKESALSRQVRDLLGIIGQLTEHDRWVGRDWIMWRENSGVVNVGGRRMRMGSPGIADFMGVVRGVPVAIELKGSGGKLRSTQRKFAAEFRAAGGIYTVVYAAEDVARLVDDTQIVERD